VVTPAERIAFRPCAACGFRGLWPLVDSAEQHEEAGGHFGLLLVDLVPSYEDWKLAELEGLLRALIRHGGSPGPVQAWLEREFALVMRRMRRTRRRDFTQGVVNEAICSNLTARGPLPEGDCWFVCGPRGVRPVWLVKSGDNARPPKGRP
jgi:hypothetical protein